MWVLDEGKEEREREREGERRKEREREGGRRRKRGREREGGGRRVVSMHSSMCTLIHIFISMATSHFIYDT